MLAQDEMPESPESIYLHIQGKLQTPEDYPEIEILHDFTRLLGVAGKLIQENGHLKARTASCDTLIEEMTIETFSKDMEIFNLTTQFEKITEITENDH